MTLLSPLFTWLADNRRFIYLVPAIFLPQVVRDIFAPPKDGSAFVSARKREPR